MRIVFNHLTIGLIYRDGARLIPAFAGTIISFFYQLINLYGSLPAGFLVVIFLAMVSTIFSYTLHLFSLFFIPLPICAIITLTILAASFIAWLFINIRINRTAKLKIFKLNYSSRLAFNGLAVLLCNQALTINISPETRFWDVHFKPGLAGNLKPYDPEILNKLIQEDFIQIQQVLGHDAALFGCTPGSIAKYLGHLPLDNYTFQVLKTLIPLEHAKIFGLVRDFYFHVINLQ